MTEELVNRETCPELFSNSDEIERLGNDAVRQVQRANSVEGIPNVYSCDGKIFYEVNGVITTQSPFESIKTVPDKRIVIGDNHFKEYISEKDIMDAVSRHSLDVSLKLQKFEKSEDIIFMVMMNSGSWYAGQLFNRLQANAYRVMYSTIIYHNDKVKVSTRAKRKDLTGKHIILISGMSSGGSGVAKMTKWLLNMGASTVDPCVMMKRNSFALETINSPILINDDDFIIGCGIGYNDYGRNLNVLYKLV